MVGVDLPAMLALAEALGYDRRTMAALLPAAEAGMIEGFRKLQDQQQHDPDPNED